MVNLFSIAAALVLYHFPTRPLGFELGFCLYTYLAVVAVIDIEHRLILFPVSIFGMLAGAAMGIYLHGLERTLLGGLTGFVAMFLLYYLGGLFAKGVAKFRGQTLDEPALGFGDVMLSGVIGFILGWPGIIAGLTFAILFGGFFSMILILSRMIKKTYTPFLAIPYGPFLILGTAVLIYRF
jgi:leader peptidase (prepilin peptidase)/N-methyltransferase